MAGPFAARRAARPGARRSGSAQTGTPELLHEGQTIDDEGIVSGDPPATETLGFRWSAVNNLFLTAGEAAADEWRAARAADEENADRELKQFVWAEPVLPSKLNQTTPRASRSAWTSASSCATGRRLPGRPIRPPRMCWTTGQVEVASAFLGVEQAVMVALQELWDMVAAGWPLGTLDGDRVLPQQVWIDAGYVTPVVYAFCRESGDRFRPVVGRGAGQQHRNEDLGRTTQTGSAVRAIGKGYHASWLPTEQLHLFEADADHWKSFTHGRLSTPLGKPGAMALFHAQPQDHLALARHVTAEVKVEEFVAGKGVTVKWERVRRDNHWFDVLSYACIAAHACGVRLVAEKVPETPRALVPRVSHPDWIDPHEWVNRGRDRW
jgi:hypothetical protein